MPALAGWISVIAGSMVGGLVPKPFVGQRQTGKDSSVKVWLTSFKPDASPEMILEPQAPILFSASNAALAGVASSHIGVNISVDVDTKLQSMIGYGAAMPHASAKVLVDLKRRSLALYTEVLERMFGSGDKSAAINMMRFPIGVCDFSMTWATWDDHAGDYELSRFELDADTELIVEVLKDAKAINGDLFLMATPWTPPAWLKTNHSLAGRDNNNTLVDTDGAYGAYAKYLAQASSTLKTRGLPLSYMTLQNEPLNGQTGIPAMHLDAAQAVRLGKEVRRLLDAQDDSVKLLAYDHNWDRADYPRDAIAGAGNGVFVGTAWHCYGGNMAPTQDSNHDLFPSLEQHLTECTAHYDTTVGCNLSRGTLNFGWDHEWDMQHLFLGNAARWGQSGMKWISALDEHCGPTLKKFNASWTPRGLLAVPSWAEHIDDVVFHQDFWTIAHMARFVKRGSRRIKSRGERGDALVEAFEDSRSQTVSLMAQNPHHTHAMQLEIRYGDAKLSYRVPAWGTAVLVWDSLAGRPSLDVHV